MSLKLNINRLHGEFLNNFEDVVITEKSSTEFQEYFELSAIKEGKQIVMILPKREVEKDRFNWKYYSNPDKKDFLVERSSSIETVLQDVTDIFEKNRFDSNYLKNI